MRGSIDLEAESSDCLYEVLRVPRTATTADIKKAYFVLARQHHPDKLSPSASKQSIAEATATFQQVSRAYELLSDEDRRRRYDASGCTDDSIGGEGADWADYWRAMYQRVTEEDIIKIKQSYQNTEEERLDVIKFYKQFKGDMNKIMESVLCSEYEDESRFMTYLQPLIESGDVPTFAKWATSTSRLARNKRKQSEIGEVLELQDYRKSKRKPSKVEYDLPLIKRNVPKEMNRIADSLAEKYGNESKAKGKKKVERMPTDEEFEAIQNSLKK